MERLIIFGQEFDVNTEIEIKVDRTELGMDCYIVYNDGTSETAHNCTEFHHLYDKSYGFTRVSSAFESDIHQTGMTKEVKYIKWIVVVKSIKLNPEY
jgi:hypothetical protein